MKRILLLLALSLAITSTLSSQDAKVIQLSDADARSAKDKWLALQDAQKDWNSFQDRIARDYTQRGGKNCPVLNQEQSWQTCSDISGWSGGFVFTEDFKYIVPKPYVAPKDWGSCCVITTPIWPSWTVQ